MIDNDRFNELFHEHYSAIYKYCLAKLDNKSYADDVTNEVFEILGRKWGKLDIDKPLRPWLYRVSDNCVKRANAEVSKHHHIDYDDAEELLNSEKSDYDGEIFSDVDKEADGQRLNELLEVAVTYMSDEEKIIFKYRFVEKRTLTDVSKLTGIPYSTLRLRVSHIIQKARKGIREFYNK